jgi:uncharacterized membrane protein (UPF0127 family)
MTILLIALAIVLIAAFIFAWRFFLGTPNAQLPTAQMTVASSIPSSSAVGGASSSSPSSGIGSATSNSPSDDTDVDIANPTLPEETLSIDRGTWTVELATTMTEQARGLSYRTSLGAQSGMLFIFPSAGTQSFWMKDMNFPLDMIWVASDGTVAGFAQDVPAPAPGEALWELQTYQSPSDTSQVLEVNAGTVAKYGIKVGDKVTLRPMQ